jgi:hypothetical protein
MELIQQFVQHHAGSLISQLVERLGFEPAQAERFVPAAADKLVAALSGGGLDVASLLGGADLSSLLGKIDVAGLAEDAGVGEEQARGGLEAIAPAMLSALGDQAGGAEALLGALGGDAGGGLLGAAGKLAGGLFGKD